MTQFDWTNWLNQWNEELMSSLLNEETLNFNDYQVTVLDLSPEVVTSKWLGYPGASDEQLKQAELRLGIQLPPSYREFLQISNGWRQPYHFVMRLWSAEDIEWLRVRHQEDLIDPWVEGQGGEISVSDEDYFVYGEEQSCLNFRVQYLYTALEISDYGDSAFYLLNPQVVSPDGEWEAWFFASWLPGANRYRSFWELMQAEQERWLRLKSAS